MAYAFGTTLGPLGAVIYVSALRFIQLVIIILGYRRRLYRQFHFGWGRNCSDLLLPPGDTDSAKMDSFALTEGLVPEHNSQDGHESENTAGKLPEGANKFQRAIAAWRGMMLRFARRSSRLL